MSSPLARVLATVPQGPNTNSIRFADVDSDGRIVLQGTVLTNVGMLSSYVPMPGDVVALIRQDGAWLAVGSLGSDPVSPFTTVYSMAEDFLSLVTDMEEVPGLAFDVRPGIAYDVKLLLSYSCVSTAADADFDWGRTGGVENSDIRRFIIGLAAGTATNQDSNVAMPRRDGDTDQRIGTDGGVGSGVTTYREDVVVIPSGEGRVSFRAAQGNLDPEPLRITVASKLVVTRAMIG